MSMVNSVGTRNKSGNVLLADLASNSGTLTLNGATEVTVADTGVTADSVILLIGNAPAGTPSAPYLNSKTADTGFGVKAGASNTGTVNWYRFG